MPLPTLCGQQAEPQDFHDWLREQARPKGLIAPLPAGEPGSRGSRTVAPRLSARSPSLSVSLIGTSAGSWT
jgi:hypothetical protein